MGTQGLLRNAKKMTRTIGGMALIQSVDTKTNCPTSKPPYYPTGNSMVIPPTFTMTSFPFLSYSHLLRYQVLFFL